MITQFDGYNYIVRLDKGEKLVEQLTRFVVDNQLTGGWVLALGGLAWAELGFYDLSAQQYEWQRLDELLELTSLQGNIAWQDGKPVLHLHATVSDASMHARGGHLREAEVAGTLEVFVHVWNKGELKRAPDAEVGLSTLDL